MVVCFQGDLCYMCAAVRLILVVSRSLWGLRGICRTCCCRRLIDCLVELTVGLWVFCHGVCRAWLLFGGFLVFLVADSLTFLDVGWCLVGSLVATLILCCVISAILVSEEGLVSSAICTTSLGLASVDWELLLPGSSWVFWLANLC